MTRPKTLTHATQERMRQDTRRQEETRSDHLSKLKADSLINTFQQSDERITAKRHLRRLAQEEHEREIQKGILMTAEEKRQKEAQQHAEEELANQLECLRLEKMRDEKMRQQIRETSYKEVLLKCHIQGKTVISGDLWWFLGYFTPLQVISYQIGCLGSS